MGSLLGDMEDISRRKHLARVAFNHHWKIYVNGKHLSEELRLRIYKAYVRPVLLYNCGTWGITETCMEALESFHRAQLRRVLRVFYPQIMSCDEVYKRSGSRPLRFDLLEARWKSFGHILRRSQNIPSYLTMVEYFECEERKWSGRQVMCLPLRLHKDLQLVGKSLTSLEDLTYLRNLAQDRGEWWNMTSVILSESERLYCRAKERTASALRRDD